MDEIVLRTAMSAHPDFPGRPKSTKSGVPRYAEIQRDIERKIMSGEWPPGFRIPSEIELVRQYGCARMTVNKALSSLAASGMIVRKRRSGSFVGRPRMEEPLLSVQDIKEQVLGNGKSYRYQLLDRVVRTVSDKFDAQHVGVPLHTRLLAIEAIHFADELPVTYETRQISLLAVPQAEEESFETEPPGSWLLHHVPWTRAEHSIRAILADKLMADRLQIAKGDACLSIARRTWQMSKLVTFVRLLYPGERHRFTASFDPARP